MIRFTKKQAVAVLTNVPLEFGSPAQLEAVEALEEWQAVTDFLQQMRGSRRCDLLAVQSVVTHELMKLEASRV